MGRGDVKPNPKILLDIISDVRATPDAAVYLGDSLFKDVAMAQKAGVDDVLAEYGEAHNRSSYELLREVTHWTDKQVELEKKITHDDVSPNVILTENISEILDHFEFAASIENGN